MNPNRLLKKTTILTRENNFLKENIHRVSKRAILAEEQLQDHKLLLEGATNRIFSTEKKLQELKLLLEDMTKRAVSSEEQLQEHKLEGMTKRAVSAEQLQEHKPLQVRSEKDLKQMGPWFRTYV